MDIKSVVPSEMVVGGVKFNEYVEYVYSLLPELTVSLDPDPLEYGPARLSEKISECRTHLDKTEMVFKQISEMIHHAKRRLRKAEYDLELAKMALISSDPEVRSGRSEKERESIALMKLQEESQLKYDLESAVEDLTAIMHVVKATRADLKDIRARIKDQMTLCQEEIGLGRVWGSKPVRKGGEEKPKKGKGPTLDEILSETLKDDAILDDEVSQGEAEDALDALDDILEEPEEEQTSEDVDINSVFDSLLDD